MSWPQTSGLPLKGSQEAAAAAMAVRRRMIVGRRGRTRDEEEHHRHAQHRARLCVCHEHVRCARKRNDDCRNRQLPTVVQDLAKRGDH